MAAADDDELALPIPKPRRRRRPSFLPLRVHVELVCEAPAAKPVQITGSGDVYDFLREHAARWDRERFLTIILDNKNRVLGVEEVSVGCLTGTLVHPREVFKALILANAASFIIVHNHPSGDPAPSEEDLRVTRRLKQVGETIGITLLDHVILGTDRYVSVADDKLW